MSKESEILKIEEKKLLSKKRIFYSLLAIAIAMGVLLIYAMVELFI